MIKDRDSRAIRAHVLRYNGTSLEEVADLATQGIQGFGHKGELQIKTDNEVALLDLRRSVVRKLDAVLLPITPPLANPLATDPSRQEQKPSKDYFEFISSSSRAKQIYICRRPTPS